jgi:hypothetical protein
VLLTRVNDSRIDQAACEWQERHLAAREFQDAYDHCSGRLTAEQSRLAELQTEQKRLDILVESTTHRHNELQRLDAQGLVAKERVARLAVDDAKHKHEQAKKKWIACQVRRDETEAEVTRARDALIRSAQHAGRTLQKLGRAVPFSSAALAAALDDATKSAQPENELADLPLADLRQAADTTAQTLDRSFRPPRTGSTRWPSGAISLPPKSRKRKTGAKLFRWSKLCQAQRALQQKLLRARPLYDGLVPPGRHRPRTRSARTAHRRRRARHLGHRRGQCCGRACAALPRFPEHSLAVVASDTEPHPHDWLRRYFDYDSSDGDALLVLQHQLDARYGPHVEPFLDQSILHFRLREQVLVPRRPVCSAPSSASASWSAKCASWRSAAWPRRKSVRTPHANSTACASGAGAIGLYKTLLDEIDGDVRRCVKR